MTYITRGEPGIKISDGANRRRLIFYREVYPEGPISLCPYIRFCLGLSITQKVFAEGGPRCVRTALVPSHIHGERVSLQFPGRFRIKRRKYFIASIILCENMRLNGKMCAKAINKERFIRATRIK